MVDPMPKVEPIPMVDIIPVSILSLGLFSPDMYYCLRRRFIESFPLVTDSIGQSPDVQLNNSDYFCDQVSLCDRAVETRSLIL